MLKLKIAKPKTIKVKYNTHFPDIILANLQEKEVTPTKEEQLIEADLGYDGLKQVLVNEIPDNYIEPTGTKEIVENGIHNVKEFENVDVNILYTPNYQEKTVIPIKGEQEIIADEGYDALEKVNVMPIAEEYIIPSGELNINENGQYDVTDKSSVNVEIENTGVGDIEEYFNTNMVLTEPSPTDWYNADYEYKYLVNEDLTKAMVCNDNNEILMVDINEANNYHSKWLTIGTSSSCEIKNLDLDLYLRYQNDELILNTRSTTWSNSNNYIRARSGNSYVYLKEENGYIVASSGSSTAMKFFGLLFKGMHIPESLINRYMKKMYLKKMPDLIIPDNITKLDYLCADYTMNLVPKVICGNNITSMIYMYSGCNGSDEIDITGLNTENVTTMERIFANCNKVKALDLKNFNTSNVVDIKYMFMNCYELTKLDFSNFNTSKVTDMSYMFYGCTGLEELDVSDFDMDLVTNIVYMFYDCEKLKTLDLSNWLVSNITSLYGVFYSCSKLEALDLKGFDTSLVTTMQQCFYGCHALTNLDVSSFDTKKVTTMHQMFYNCKSLTELDLSNFETTNLTNLYQTFYGCINLTKLDIRNFDFSKITSYTNIFGNSTSTYVPADCLIIVKDDTAKTWITSKISRMTNVKTIEEYELEQASVE